VLKKCASCERSLQTGPTLCLGSVKRSESHARPFTGIYRATIANPASIPVMEVSFVAF
jgi:hypothetical protein